MPSLDRVSRSELRLDFLLEGKLMRHFPIFVAIKRRPVLVVGGGDNAVRKIRLLKKADPLITVVAPSLCAELAEMAAIGKVQHLAKPFEQEDVTGKALVFATTGIDTVDNAVSQAARARGVLVNAVDKPRISDYIIPAIVDRSPLVIAICSSGAAPTLVRNLREKLEAMLHPAVGRLASFADSFRSAVVATRENAVDRRRFWEDFFDGPLAQSVLSGRLQRAREQMLKLVNEGPRSVPRKGHVAVVGAGPGDPDLLTFKAMRFMQKADVVVYDRLVDRAVLEYVRRDADRIYVGKAPGNHRMTQEEIGALLVDLGRKGKRVVRLKGGDPFIFGRVGEEMEVLRAAAVDFDLVPGVTAASGCAAAGAIPLTHREHASMVTFVAGHPGDGLEEADWSNLVNARQTVVFHMAVGKAQIISERLIELGMRPDMPVVFIEKGTRPDQRIVPTVIRKLQETVTQFNIGAPALIVVGDVSGYAQLDLGLGEHDENMSALQRAATF